MLTFNFTRIFKLRGIDKPFSYLVKLGYSANYSTRIVNNRMERLSLKDIEKLCELFQCTPNDLLEWIPRSNEVKNDNHPLSSLKRSNKVVQLTTMLHAVPLDKLADVETMINEILKK
ncbi:helix-turn-helix domain-containing protein [Williamwhitmania taraxaci]|uniref:Cro/C1-type HTH DNA-binding domain-containing protein n=1 Tax=Williamwhitmania taraxaci TaxID=1640674 RepID=A0A1G6LQK6_9BACT|nr:helix-turn-helix transcriptional regulator [Williamwhitmania taraxaci]SDC45540.1 Cro/C1-type HTH DNA-binding domain-containing protein [Williamwhitmania taraxaci]